MTRSPRPAAADPSRTLLLAALTLIACVTLLPFDFRPGPHDRGTGSVLEQFEPVFARHFSRLEWTANVLLFVPLGLALGRLLIRRGIRAPAALTATAAAGLLLAAAIELLQVWYPTRVPSLRDLSANTLGAFLGAAGAWTAGGRIESGLSAAFARSRPVLRRLASGPAFLGYVLIVGLASAGSSTRGALAGWRLDYPLVLGNEATGDRPWRGRMRELRIADRAADPEAARGLLSGDAADSVFGEEWVASYDLTAAAPGIDRSGHLEELRWRGEEARDAGPDGVRLGPEGWLATPSSAGGLASRLRDSSQLTLLTTLAPAGPEQYGPARIVTISPDPMHRNLTLGQSGRDLVLRLRTRATGVEGARPAIVVPEVFPDRAWRRLVVTYDSAVVSVWVGPPVRRYTVALTPETTFLHKYLGRSRWRLRLGTAQPAIYALAYLACVFLPAGWLLGMAVERSGRSRALDRWLLWAGLLLPPALLEAIWAGARGPRPWFAPAGAALTGVGVLARRAWSRRRGRHAAG